VSNAKYIIVDGLEGATEYLPVATYFLKVVRKLGHTSITKTFYVGKAEIRIHLDQYAGDRVYIKAAKCPIVTFSGLLDTFRDKVRPPGHTPKYLIDNQLAKEYRLPRSPSAPVPTAKLMYGVRPISATARLVDGLSGDAVPTITQGVDGDLYTVDGTTDVYQKELGQWYLLPQDPGEPRLTTKLPVEATSAAYYDMYGDPIDPPTADIDYSGFKESYRTLLPSKFTGLMRQVVQATFGSAAWVNFGTTIDKNGNNVPARAPVNYTYGDSWGCIKHNKKFFFLQITTEAIYYVPAKYCYSVDKNKHDVVILLSTDVKNKVKLGDIPAGLGGSWGAELGWSFSYTQPEASIVLNSGIILGTELGTQQTYVTVSLATVQVSFSDSGIPKSATFSATPPQVFYNDLYFMDKATGKGLFHIPQVVAGEMVNITVNFGPDRLNHAPPIGYVADKIPVYVYYTKSGMQTCEYTWRKYLAYAETIPTPTTRSVKSASTWSQGSGAESWTLLDSYDRFVGTAWWGSKATTGYTDWGFSVSGSGLQHASGGVNNNYASVNPGGATGYGPSGFSAKSEHWGYTIQVDYNPSYPTQTPYTIDVSLTTVFAGSVMSRLGAARGTRGIGSWDYTIASGGSSSVDSSITLSVLDREAAVLYVVKSSSAKSSVNTSNPIRVDKYVVDDQMMFGNGFDGVSDIQNITTSLKPTYPYIGNCGASNSNHHDFGLPRCYMRDAATDEPVSAAYSLYSATSVQLQNVLRVESNYSNSCGAYVQYADTYTDPVTYNQVVVDSSTAASTTSSATLYSHDLPIGLPIEPRTNELLAVHPANGFPLAYQFSQAAFDPSNHIAHKSDLNSPLVAKVGATTYDVKNKLFGWIGVV